MTSSDTAPTHLQLQLYTGGKIHQQIQGHLSLLNTSVNFSFVSVDFKV